MKSIYISRTTGGSHTALWKANADGSKVEKFLDTSCIVSCAAPDGKYLLGFIPQGDGLGIYEISISERKLIPLVPGVECIGTRFARDGKSFLYPVGSGRQITFYRQAWRDGKLIGNPQIALKLPFSFSLGNYQGNAFDFSQDLSTIVYARPGGQSDLYFLSTAP